MAAVSSRATVTALGAALALHGAVVVAVASGPVTQGPAIGNAAPLEVTFEAAFEAAPEPLPVPTRPAPRSDDAPTVAMRSPLAALLPGPPRAQSPAALEPAPVVASAGAAEPPLGPAIRGDLAFDPRAAAVTPPVASSLRYGLPLGSFSDGPPAASGPRVSARDPGPVDAARVLRDAATAHDLARGTGFGGPVAAAGRSVLLSGQAPTTGQGRYEVRTDASGRVVSVRALGGDAAWQALAQTLASALAGRTLRVPPDSKGVVVVVALSAKTKAIAGDGEGIMSFDVANLAAGPARVVSSRIESERTL